MSERASESLKIFFAKKLKRYKNSFFVEETQDFESDIEREIPQKW